MGLTATVLGASGFSGGEVLRVLSGHGGISVVAAAAHDHAGATVGDLHPHLRGALDLDLATVAEVAATDADVCFSCLPSGALRDLSDGVAAEIVIDLSDDFRSSPGWVYGLTEFARSQLTEVARVANPGCYPTAALLCLVPFARAGLIRGPIIIDALSGLSGAGRRTDDHLMFAAADANASAYGSTSHRHIPEMEVGLQRFGEIEATVSFTPHLVPMGRGLLVTARAPLESKLGDDEAIQLLRSAYADEPFVSVTSEWPSTKAVSGSNRAHLSARVDRRNSLLVASAAIDNLGKGAAGQAVQNANVLFGLDETTGLDSLGVWP